MGKPTEALDHNEMLPGVVETTLENRSVLITAFSNQLLEHSHRAALVVEGLGMLERHVEKSALDWAK